MFNTTLPCQRCNGSGRDCLELVRGYGENAYLELIDYGECRVCQGTGELPTPCDYCALPALGCNDAGEFLCAECLHDAAELDEAFEHAQAVLPSRS